MYIRKKKNRSGTISIVVVSKARGFYEEIHNFGTASTDDEVAALYAQAQHWLKSRGDQLSLDF